MAPSAYMTDEVWKEMVPYFCKAIRATEVVKDHREVLGIFNQHKIFIIKEEGDTSQVNKPYDQFVAKNDMLKIHSLLDVVQHRVKRMLTQWDLIVICCHALNCVKPESWIDSFKKVNLHPNFCKGFTEWKKQI